MNELVEKITDRLLNIKQAAFHEVCPISIIDINNWEWAQGVSMYGIYKCYKEMGMEAYLSKMIQWYDSRIREGLPDKNVNTTAPMLALAYLAEETGRKDYMDLCIKWVEWIMEDMPRTKERGIQHCVSGEENHGQLWSDTLFMTVLFVAKMGTLMQNRAYIEEAKKQFLIHIKYLYDKESGLWYHGWTFEGNNNFAKAHWARGNCWYIISVVEFIEMIELDDALKNYLLDILNAQLQALKELQDISGGWHTLLDDASSYLEVSAAAGFGYGILKAVRLGLIGQQYKDMGDKALKYLKENITAEGVVENVSYGTGMGHTLEDYKKIPLCSMTYGQALAILALIEETHK